VGSHTWFLSQLQPSPWNIEIGIPLDQRPFVFGAEPSANFDGSGGIAISCLQLQISSRSPDAATLAAHERRSELTFSRLKREKDGEPGTLPSPPPTFASVDPP
jgi:hypothetical protein